MNRLSEFPYQTQATFRPIGEIMQTLAQPLSLAAARLEWLAHDEECEAADAEAFGNPALVSLQRFHGAAMMLAAERCRHALDSDSLSEGFGYGPAVVLLNRLASTVDRDRPLSAAHQCEAAALRYAADVLARETPPTVDALAV